MVGDTIRESRIRKGLTQAKLARLAGVSRRHLAALEKGANVSVAVLRKVATVLELTEIHLGGLSLRSGTPELPSVNMPLLTDTIREARAEALRAETMLARAEGILGHAPTSRDVLVSQFPRLPVRRLDIMRERMELERIAEHPEMITVPLAADIAQGEPVVELKDQTVTIPAAIIEKGELVFRARGDKLKHEGIHDGDLLIVELRPKGRANTGELVIAKVGDIAYIGRWWQKNEKRALMSDGMAEVTVGKNTRALKVVAAVNQILRIIT